MALDDSLLLVAGSGEYPRLVVEGARRAGVKRVCVAAFEGETAEGVAVLGDEVRWLRVGQLGGLVDYARRARCERAIFAGQIAPKNLFELRPDFRALLVLARLKRRNAETLFGAVAEELEKGAGCRVLPATTYVEEHLAPEGHIGGPRGKKRLEEDFAFGFEIAKGVSRMDIGQTVVVKKGTVLAVEAFEGTNECIRRGGKLGRGGCVMVKVMKPGQDMRFDVPVIGVRTLEVAAEAGIIGIGVEAGKTLILDKKLVCEEAERKGITLWGISERV